MKKKNKASFLQPHGHTLTGTHTHTHTDAHAHTLALCPFGSSVLVFPSSIKLRYFRLRCIQYSPSSLSQVTVSGGSNLIPAQNLWEPFFNRELSSLVSDAAHSFKLVFISLWHGIFFFFFWALTSWIFVWFQQKIPHLSLDYWPETLDIHLPFRDSGKAHYHQYTMSSFPTMYLPFQ